MPGQLTTQADKLSAETIKDLNSRLMVGPAEPAYLNTAISPEAPLESAVLDFALYLDSYMRRENLNRDYDGNGTWSSFYRQTDALILGNERNKTKKLEGSDEILKACFDNYHNNIEQNKHSKKLSNWKNDNAILTRWVKKSALQDTLINLFQATTIELEKNKNKELNGKNTNKIALALSKK